MSLAFHASPFENDSNEIKYENNGNIIARKKIAHDQHRNRTQKRHQTVNTDKVNSILASIHNSSANDNDELADFNPPSKPISMGAQNTILRENNKEGMMNISSQMNQSPPDQSLHQMQMFNSDTDESHLNSIQNNYGDSQTAEDYYKKMLPNFSATPNQQNNSHQNTTQYMQRHMESSPVSPQSSTMMHNGDNIMEKLNYMINLLEENHDERTGNVTEEVVLYSFLGIFIIFIADSFARVGKYTR
jgi:hypothetical protein